MRVETTGLLVTLRQSVSTVGRGPGVDVALRDVSVSRLHAELVRRGPHLYVCDLGLSATGTRVNGRPVGRRLLANGDVISFGLARVQVQGLHIGAATETAATEFLGASRRGAGTPAELTVREQAVLDALCRSRTDEAFTTAASTHDIAAELNTTDTAVKAHLLRLYAKFDIPVGVGRRNRLANAAISTGHVKPRRRADPATDTDRRLHPPQPGDATHPLPLEPPVP